MDIGAIRMAAAGVVVAITTLLVAAAPRLAAAQEYVERDEATNTWTVHPYDWASDPDLEGWYCWYDDAELEAWILDGHQASEKPCIYEGCVYSPDPQDCLEPYRRPLVVDGIPNPPVLVRAASAKLDGLPKLPHALFFEFVAKNLEIAEYFRFDDEHLQQALDEAATSGPDAKVVLDAGTFYLGRWHPFAVPDITRAYYSVQVAGFTGSLSGRGQGVTFVEPMQDISRGLENVGLMIRFYGGDFRVTDITFRSPQLRDGSAHAKQVLSFVAVLGSPDGGETSARLERLSFEGFSHDLQPDGGTDFGYYIGRAIHLGNAWFPATVGKIVVRDCSFANAVHGILPMRLTGGQLVISDNRAYDMLNFVGMGPFVTGTEITISHNVAERTTIGAWLDTASTSTSTISHNRFEILKRPGLSGFGYGVHGVLARQNPDSRLVVVDNEFELMEGAWTGVDFSGNEGEIHHNRFSGAAWYGVRTGSPTADCSITANEMALLDADYDVYFRSGTTGCTVVGEGRDETLVYDAGENNIVVRATRVIPFAD